MEMIELEIALSVILKNQEFVAKDTKGNHMYSNSLKRYRCFRYLNTDIGIQETAEELNIKNDTTITDTEKETLVKSRRGQGKYRDNLVDKYNGQCIMTGTSLKQVLVASHIKPWAVCNNVERIDVNNGLLLSATYDRLFDSGLITFNKNGKISISSMIDSKNANILMLKNGTIYDIKYNQAMQKYLSYHNDCIFVR